ncbi:MAG TPA: FHA domain-containing protein [Anaerolineaceae bacterium]|jgi:hypothetical protein|nr:FHA domain-containing protein [Anaerolineaceae bacterium]HOD04206.1 FHA domain-containing protein [Anaerolineaceae bacterium]HOG80077.1 FHA domain-containing protein [Anaerolineaceae bacterium]
MTAILTLIFRILLAAALYGFLAWALITLWRDLQMQTQILQPRKPPALHLAVDLGGELIESDLEQPEIILGRDPGCDLQVPHETVSGRHARLSYHHKQWWVEDLQSTNGTYLNEDRILTPTVLTIGDELLLGQVSIQISSGKANGN